jgi:hypothetical protein
MKYRDKIITGEKIQQFANIYLGYNQDFNYNPLISKDAHKHVCITDISTPYDNPYIIFFYTHMIHNVASIIHLFNNPFILLSHNSDYNIVESEDVSNILNCSNLHKWYTQNLCFYHPKLFMLPIGFANSMWPHGNLSVFDNDYFVNSLSNKTKKVYFNFNINTNVSKRKTCYEIVSKKVQWLNNMNPIHNLLRMKDYEFCVCPEGNGADTHRIWEALYLKCVPIVIHSPFIETLLRYNIPLVVLQKWEDLDINNLHYSMYKFDDYSIDNFLRPWPYSFSQNC